MVSGYPKFSAPPSGETMHQNQKVFEVQERARGPLYHAKFGGARTSPAVAAAKNVEFLQRAAMLALQALY